MDNCSLKVIIDLLNRYSLAENILREVIFKPPLDKITNVFEGGKYMSTTVNVSNKTL